MEYLLEWQYLIFVLPFLAAVLMLAMMTTGVFEFGGADADVDADLDMDHDIDVDADHDVSHPDHDLDIDHDADFFMKILGVLGVGKVPLSIVLMTFCLVWSFTGFWSNRLLENVFQLPMIYAWISIALAFFASVSLTRFVANSIAKIMPKTETYATEATDLVGKRGTVLNTVRHDSGTVRVRDQYSNPLDLQARVENSNEPLLPGTGIVVIDYDPIDKIYRVGRDQLAVVEAETSSKE